MVLNSIFNHLPTWLKNIIHSVYGKIVASMGYFDLRKLEKEKNTFYMICPFGIGDIVFALKAIESKKIDRKICVLVRSQHATLSKIYKDIDFIADTKLCKHIERYIITSGSYETSNHLYCFFKKDAYLNVLHNFVSEPYSLWHDYCSDVYHINPENMRNCSEKAVGSASVELTNRDIILMPYAHSTDLIPLDFWSKLTKELQQKGYKIYTNIAPYEKPISGTEPLCLPLYEVCAAFENSAGCISMRSGICDLLAIKSQTPLYILNSSPHWTPIWDATYFRNNGIHNFLYSAEEEMIDTIIQLF